MIDYISTRMPGPELSDSQVIFEDRRYGKNYVRLLHVQREGSWHSIKELEVSTKLTLNDTRDFVFGDNSKVIATDSQKNTVYILAKKNGVSTMYCVLVLYCK